MTNIHDSSIVTAIVLPHFKFEEILHTIFGVDIQMEISLDGIWIGFPGSELSQEELFEGLAKYFDVEEVTSVHADDCEYPIGVWIAYKN